MNTKHTPTPWVLESDDDGQPRKLTDADGEFVSFVTGSRYSDDRHDPVAQANAAHIVRCVNAWDDAAALRARLAELGAA